MKEIYHIDIDKEIFGIEDAKEAAQSIFSLQQSDFESIINEKWYRRFLSALTLHARDRKKVIKSISSLSKLQSLFMKVYCDHYRMLDEDLNKVIDDLLKINTTVRKLYQMCVAQIRPQQSLADLASHDKQILLLLLSKYQSLSGVDATLQKYRAGIATVVAEKLPEGEYDNTQLLTISAPKVFYRCLLEMCALDGELDAMTMPDNIYDALNYLNISPVEKKNVENTLRSEVKAFGEEYLLSKYTPEYNFGTCAVTDASEMELISEESKIDSDYSNDTEDLNKAMGTDSSAKEKEDTVRKCIEQDKSSSDGIPNNIIKKAYQLCLTHGCIKAETDDFLCVKEKDNLHIIEKKTGTENLFHLDGTPVAGNWNVCIGCGNKIFIQLGVNRAIYQIDVIAKTIQQLYENKECGELIFVTAEHLVLIDTSTKKCLRKISQQSEELVHLPDPIWNGTAYKYAVWNNRMYVFVVTNSLVDRALPVNFLKFSIYSVDMNCPEEYVAVKDNLIGYNQFHYNWNIDVSRAGWVILGENDYSEDAEAFQNNHHFPLQYFSFEDASVTTLAYDCGYKTTIKRNLFSKESPLWHPNRFFVFGSTVCYKSGEKQFDAMVDLSDPLAVKYT